VAWSGEAQDVGHGRWALIRNTFGLVVLGLAMVLLGAFWVKSSPVAMALVVIGACAIILGIVLNLAEGPVQIGPSGLKFTLRQRVMQMSVDRNLSKKETKMAVETAKALERETRPRQRQLELIQELRRPTAKTPPKEPLPDKTFSEWLAQMRASQELLGHGEVSPEDRRKAEAIVDDVAEDIVEAAPRRVKKKKRTTRAPRR
jgi:hypothetical protein